MAIQISVEILAVQPVACVNRQMPDLLVERTRHLNERELPPSEALYLAPENVPAARSPAQPHLGTTRLSDTRTRS